MQKLYLKNWRKNILDKYKIHIYPKAIRELDSIYDYIANEKRALENSRDQANRIKTAILKLATFP